MEKIGDRSVVYNRCQVYLVIEVTHCHVCLKFELDDKSLFAKNEFKLRLSVYYTRYIFL